MMAQNYNPILVEVEPQTEIDLTRIDRLKPTTLLNGVATLSYSKLK